MASCLCSFSFLNYLIYLSNLGISFFLPMTYNMRLDFFGRCQEFGREYRDAYILDSLAGF